MKELICSYLRVSTANQRDAETIETQRYALDRYCELYSIQVDRRFEDDGVSGGIEIHKRPDGRELYKLINTGSVKTLLLFHADRIGRDTIDSLLFHRLAESQGTRIIGTADGTDTGREGSVFTTEMRAVVAAELRRDCSRRTKSGLRRRASEGKVSTHPPFGYSVEGGRLVVDEPKAEIVAQMFARMAHGERTGDIVNWLNESNAPSPRGKGWRHDTFIYLLKNRAYVGEFVSFRTPRRRSGGGARIPRDPKEQVIIPCPAIVSQELFEAAKARIAFNRRWGATPTARLYMLKSLIHCARCAHAFVGHAVVGRHYKGKTYPEFRYYECGSLTNRDYEFCGNARVNASRLEAAVWSQIESFISSPSKVLERLAARHNRQAVAGNVAAERRRKRIESLKVKNLESRDRLTLAVARGVVSDDDARRASEALAKEFLELERESLELNSARGEADSHKRQMLDAKAVLASLRERLEAGFSPEKKAEIARCLVRQAIVDRNGNGRPLVDIQYIFPSPVSFSPDVLAFNDSSRKK